MNTGSTFTAGAMHSSSHSYNIKLNESHISCTRLAATKILNEKHAHGAFPAEPSSTKKILHSQAEERDLKV